MLSEIILKTHDHYLGQKELCLGGMEGNHSGNVGRDKQPIALVAKQAPFIFVITFRNTSVRMLIFEFELKQPMCP